MITKDEIGKTSTQNLYSIFSSPVSSVLSDESYDLSKTIMYRGSVTDTIVITSVENIASDYYFTSSSLVQNTNIDSVFCFLDSACDIVDTRLTNDETVYPDVRERLADFIGTSSNIIQTYQDHVSICGVGYLVGNTMDAVIFPELQM